LPWLTISTASGSESLNGTTNGQIWIVQSGDGWITLLLGVILIAVGLARSTSASLAIRLAGVLASLGVFVWLMLVYVHVNDEYDNVIGKATAALMKGLGKDNPYGLH